jgi:hypothetical protein
MAQGRMLNRRISLNKKVNDLSAESALCFTWGIAHLDRDGRIHGDPDLFKQIVVPRRKDITPEKIESFIREWAEKGLVIWYETDGDFYIQYPKFRENQPGMRYEREAASHILPPENGRSLVNFDPEEIQSNAVVNPQSTPHNGMEWNRIEWNSENKPTSADADASLNAFSLYCKINDWINKIDGFYEPIEKPNNGAAEWKYLQRMAKKIQSPELVYDVFNRLHHKGKLDRGLITSWMPKEVEICMEEIHKEAALA